MKIYRPQELETKWQALWEKEGLFKVSEDPTKEKYYLLEMFLYYQCKTSIYIYL